MNEDGRPASGTITFAAGDAGTAKDVLDTRDEETFSPNDVMVSYGSAASTPATVTLYDEDAGTGSGAVSDDFATFRLGPDSTQELSGLQWRDIENDIVAVVTNNDGTVAINIGGKIVTG